MTDAHARAPQTRLGALDGLRGLASLMVVFSHALLASAPIFPTPPNEATRRWWENLLALFSDGAAAVAIFFVLSGLVLVLPLQRWSRASWIAYYPRRLLRLYLPVWASLLLALAWYFLVPRSTDTANSWMNSHGAPLLRRPLVENFLLLRAGFLNSPLWSLKWEILFSLLLPLYYTLTKLLHGRAALGAAGLALVVVASGAGLRAEWAIHLPQFLIGALLGANLPQVRACLERFPRPARAVWTVCALAMLSVAGQGAISEPLRWVLRVAGAVMVVTIFLAWAGPIRLATTPTLAWLGRISFSLYLVHEPVLVSLGYATRAAPLPTPSFVAWGTCASLVLAHLFYRCVEYPAHRLSQAVGARVRTGLEPIA